MATSDLDQFATLSLRENGLVVVTSLRADSSVQASVVNAGVLDHPTTGVRSVAFVAQGASRKVVNLRARPQTTIVQKRREIGRLHPEPGIKRGEENEERGQRAARGGFHAIPNARRGKVGVRYIYA